MALRSGAPPELLRGTGFGTRLSIALVVLANVALAVGAAALATWLATRPGLRGRIDLTASGINTLDASTRALLDRLPDDARIEIDVFFRPLDQPLTPIGAAVHERMYHVMKLAEERRPDRITITDHGLSPDPAQAAQVQARLRELGVDDLNVVVLSNGPRREVLRVFGDIAEIDLGNPIRHQGQYRPPSLRAFRGEEALLRGLLKVTQGDSLRVYFSWGNGERDLFGENEFGLGRLRAALVADGFDPARWVPDETNGVPADCAVLAIVGPSDPFTEEELAHIRAYVDAGGRLVLTPSYDQPGGAGGVGELLAGYGMGVGQGIVASPLVDAATGQVYEGNVRCSGLILRGRQMAPEHPITRPLRAADRRVRVFLFAPLLRGTPLPGAARIDLLASDEDSWEDLPDERGENDFTFDAGRERRGARSLAMVTSFAPRVVGPEVESLLPGERPESRVLAFGGPDVFSNHLFEFNRDLLLNSFNWAAGREYRVNVSQRDPELRRIDVERGGALTLVHRILVLGLPGLCLALGLFTAWRRRR